MLVTPEAIARETIDAALTAAGWAVQDVAATNLYASRGVAVREFPLKPGLRRGRLPALRRRPGGRRGRGQEGGRRPSPASRPSRRSTARACPTSCRRPSRPLPFLYESTGVETRFTNRLDPEPRSRRSSPSTGPRRCAGWLADLQRLPRRRQPTPTTLRGRLAAHAAAGRDRALAGADHGRQQPGALARRRTGRAP